MKKSPIRAWLSSISTHDFLPRTNRVFSPLRTPLAWFVIAGVTAGLTGAIVAPQGWVVCGIIFGVTLLGMAWPWLAMRGLRAAIHFDRRRCHELDEVTVVLTVTNRWPWPVWGLLIERGFFSTASHPGNPQRSATTALAQVTGWSNSRFEFSFEPPRRGIYPLEQPLLVTGFPFGLWNVRRAITVSKQLIVWPRTTDLRSLPMQSGDRLATTGRYVDRPGHDGDIIAARPYIRGDSLRRIHWVHTARRDALIVCERQTASQMGFTILLDPYAFAGNEHGLDWGLRVVASLCREFHNHACQLICQLGKDQYVIASGTASLHRLFDRLAAYRGPAARTDASALRIPARSNQQTILVTSAARWHELGHSEAGARNKSSVRAVVLEENAHRPAKHAASRRRGMAPRPWIDLVLAGEPSRQFQKQWERQCHDDWAQ
ncbi:MAG: DUF58 domain-containing protein [Planctomycetota bacterium]|nr:DUF58 domain-containing protein [Planctomycetota bacterium]